MQQAEKKLVTARWIIPVSDDNELPQVLEDHAILVENSTIKAIAPRRELEQQCGEIDTLQLEHHILAPGLVNAHGHAAMSLLRGYADDYPLMTWLQDHIWPAEAEFVDYDFVADGTALAITEMLLSGTTCFSDMYFFPDAAANTAEKLGIRAQITFPVLEVASAWARDASEYLAKGTELFDEYRHSPLVTVAFGPHAPYTVADDTFAKIAMLAEEIDCGIQVHLHETAGEIDQSLDDYGKTPVQRLAELGVLHNRTQAVHMNQLDAEDFDTLVRSGASVVHCPSSNLKLASGYCPVQKLADAGVRIALGTDSAASNNSLNMFNALRDAALQAKLTAANPCVLPAAQALRMATLGGAEALGLDQQLGSLQAGKQADMIAIDTRAPAMQPLYSPVSQLVYTSAGAHVSHCWVAGELKVQDSQLVDVDLPATLHRAQQWQHKISNRKGK